MGLLISAGELAVALDQKIEAIVEDAYANLSEGLWWERVATRKQSTTRLERLHWLINSAKIERPNAAHGGGQQIFEDMAATYTEYENLNAVAGLQIKKEKMEDVVNGIPGGEAMDIASAWGRDVGRYAVYWPQEVVADAILANPTAYDGKAFFANNHDVHPFNAAAGTYANLLTGAASGAYPGALPIDSSVTLEVALQNLAKARAYVSNIAMPNGTTPRRLRVTGMIVPPALMTRAVRLTDARTEFLASSNGPEGGAQAVIQFLGLGAPVEAHELGAAYGGSDTDYYLICDAPGSSMGAFIYSEREPFSITTHSMFTTAELARKREFEWTCEGRNVVAPGHPFNLVKVRAS